MPVTAQDWLSAAYNRSSANDPGKLATDDELLDHGNRVYQRLWALFGRARPEEAADTTTAVLAGAPPSATLADNIVDVTFAIDEDGATVNVYPETDRNRLYRLRPSIFRRGLSIISFNTAGDPLAGDTLTLTVIAAPTELTALTTDIDPRFPIRHHQIAIDSIALYLSVKDAGRSPAEQQKLVTDMRMSASAFAAEYNLPPAALSWLHAPVERQPMPA